MLPNDILDWPPAGPRRVAGTGPIGGQQTGPLASIRDPVSSGSCPQALEQIDEVLDAASVDPRLHSFRGRVRYQLAEYGAARADLTHAKERTVFAGGPSVDSTIPSAYSRTRFLRLISR